VKTFHYVKKRALLWVLFVYLSSCCSQTPCWYYEHIRACGPLYSSAVISSKEKALCKGLEIELSRTFEGLYFYLNLLSPSICRRLASENEIQVIFETNNLKVEAFAQVLEGRQRLRFYETDCVKIIELFLLSDEVKVSLKGYKAAFNTQDFNNVYKKLTKC
jgi:hypothetical protein